MILLKKKNYLETNKTTTGQNIQIENQKTEIKNLIIDGESSQESEPSPDYPSEIKSVGYENLFDYNNLITGVNVNSVGKIISDTTTNINYVKLESGKTYTFSTDTARQLVMSFFADVPKLDDTGYPRIVITNSKSYTFTLPDGYNYFVVREHKEGVAGEDNKQQKIILNKGEDAHSYIPYSKYGIEVKTTNGTDTNSSVIVLDEPLRSIGDVKDTYENGIVTRRIGRVVLNGTENMSRIWADTQNIKFGYSIEINNCVVWEDNMNKLNNVMSDKFKNYTQNGLFGLVGAGLTGICGRESTNHILIKHNDITTTEAFKTWLSTNNVEVLYELATPIIEEYEIVNVNLNEGINYISNSENANMKIEYVNYTSEIFGFNKILQSGYRINEQPNIIAKKQFANGKRKKILTSYSDVIINIDLGCFDGDTLAEYLNNLQDGEYQYYSLKDKQMKNANFIVTLPELQIDNSASEVFVGDFTAILEKSSDVE